jgi:hypothetical protein
MKVGTAQYNYFLDRIKSKLELVNQEVIDTKLEIDKQVEYIVLNRFTFEQLGLNVDKVVKYANSNNIKYNQTYTSLSSVKLNEVNTRLVSSLFKRVNYYYNNLLFVQQRLALIGTMPYSFFIYCLRLNNLNHLRKMFNGNTMYIGRNIGQLRLINKPRVISSNGVTTGVDYVATKKSKEAILNRGGVLYNKIDAEQAIVDNVNYTGEKYVVYQTSDNATWFEFTRNRQCETHNAFLYRFIPSNLKNYDKTVYNSASYYKEFTDATSIIYDDNLGCTQKIHAMEQFNPNFIYNLKR